MDLELLDQLEEKVDGAVEAVRELRMENELLREASRELEEKVAGLSRELESAAKARKEVGELRERCAELEKKLEGVRGRIERIVEKMRALEA